MPITVKETLDSLSPSQRECLMAAFESGFAQIVPIDGTKQFIGVNTDTILNFHPTQVVGVWAIGTLTVNNREESSSK